MNQILKDRVYNMGTVAQCRFLAEIGGMNDEETTMLLHFHDRKKDDYIMDVMSLDQSNFRRVESAVTSKLAVALFRCINFASDNML